MPRLPRLVIPGLPHHVTQRGIRKKRTFFGVADYLAYIRLLKHYQSKAGVRIWAYCLMPNHVHMIVVPESEASLAKFFGPVHCRYATKVNADHDWQGHLWQQRFYSTVMDERHTLVAMRYVELNPVRSGLCQRAEEWRWSSACANLGLKHDSLVETRATRALVDDWESYLAEAIQDEMMNSIRKHTRTGRPAGSDYFIRSLGSLPEQLEIPKR